MFERSYHIIDDPDSADHQGSDDPDIIAVHQDSDDPDISADHHEMMMLKSVQIIRILMTVPSVHIIKIMSLLTLPRFKMIYVDWKR